jgi:hypothetical protein
MLFQYRVNILAAVDNVDEGWRRKAQDRNQWR